MKTIHLLLASLVGVGGYDLGVAATVGCDEPEARQFDFWIGEWDVDKRQLNPAAPGDPTLYRTGQAKLHVYPVADGCAIVEHWEGSLTWGRVNGFSLRTYDTQTGDWLLLLNWPAPQSGQPATFSTLEGSFRHGRGEFFSSLVGANGNTTTSRFTFSDIAADRYRWDGASSADDGLSWKTTWIMEGKRRNALTSAPVLVGPQLASASEDCAATPESGALAFLEGRWSGETSDELPVELDVVPILGRCAVMEFVRVGAAPEWNEFRVRAYQPLEGRWIQYAVNGQTGGLLKFDATPQVARVDWESADTSGANESLRVDASQVLRWRRGQVGGRGFQAELRMRP